MFEIGKLTRLNLGYVGEGDTRTIQIDMTDWLERFPDATIKVEVRRPDKYKYMPAVELEEGVLTWTVNPGEVAIAGSGFAQIAAINLDTGAEYRSRVVETIIRESLEDFTDAELAETDPAAKWVNQVLKAAETAEQAVEKMPYIGANGNWYIWNSEVEAFVDSGMKAQGDKGETGDTGEQGPTGEKGDPGDPDAPVTLGWEQLNTYSEADRLNILEAAQPFFTEKIQNVLDSLTDASGVITIAGNEYTISGIGAVHDMLMIKDGALHIVRKVDTAAGELRTDYQYDAVACDDLSEVIEYVILPCSPGRFLTGILGRVSYMRCGAMLDGVHDDYEAMYRAHYIGNKTGCIVEQHGGTIYKACSGWLIVDDHNVDLSGSTILIDEYNRYGYYWLNASTKFDDEGLPLRSEMVEYSEKWPSAETGFPPNGIFEITRPGDATRYDDGDVTVEDRKELVRHASDGLVYSTVIDDAKADTAVRFIRYPETRIAFVGCTLSIDIGFASVAMYFMRCERSNVTISDFVVDPNRRTTMNSGYRGSVFTLNNCADVTIENIRGINIAGKPTETHPKGVSGYLLNAACVLNLTVRNCNMLGYWGATGLNGAKNVTFDNCETNRVDIHDYFANLTVNNCRIYGQTINIGYGKGSVNVSNCVVLTDAVHQIVNLRCDYGGYFEGQINISGVYAVYKGTGTFDIVSGVTLYSAESAAATGLSMRKYPKVNATNVTVRMLNSDTKPGYVLNMPEGIETAIAITDKRKVIKCSNATVYTADNAPTAFEICSIQDNMHNQEGYTLPVASADKVGGARIGYGLGMDGDVLNAEVGNNDIAPPIIPTAAGEIIAVRDSANRPLADLTLYGKTTQNGTPTPEAPVDLVSAGNGGNIGANVCGRNIFDLTASTDAASGATHAVNGHTITVTSKGTSTYSYVRWKLVSNPRPGDVYTISCAAMSASGDNVSAASLAFGIKSENSMNSVILKQSGSKSMTIPDYEGEGELRLVLYSNQTGTTVVGDTAVYENVQVEAGSVATAYEPYKDGGSVTVSTPNGLPGVPVVSGGNYTDGSGQQWLCDEVDLAKGGYVQRLRTRTLDGTESTWYSGDKNIYITLTDCLKTGKTGAMSDRYAFVNKNQSNLSAGEMTQGATVQNLCFANPDSALTMEVWKTQLAENPLTIIYPLAAPVETALSAEELTAYAALMAQYPNTTVSNNAGAGMAVSYIADTKNYIDQKIAAIAAATV